MVITKKELQNKCDELVDNFAIKYPKSFNLINENIQEIVKDKNYFWENRLEYVSIKKIHLLNHKITDFKSFIFYAFYYIIRDRSIMYSIFYEIDAFAKIIDKLFCWKNIKFLRHLQLSEINQGFANAVIELNFKFNSIEGIINSKNINTKIKKLKL